MCGNEEGSDEWTFSSGCNFSLFSSNVGTHAKMAITSTNQSVDSHNNDIGSRQHSDRYTLIAEHHVRMPDEPGNRPVERSSVVMANLPQQHLQVDLQVRTIEQRAALLQAPGVPPGSLEIIHDQEAFLLRNIDTSLLF